MKNINTKIDIEELKLKLLLGKPIEAFGYGDIKPLTINDIVDSGYSKYLRSLSMISINSEDLVKKDADDLLKSYSVFDLLLTFGDSVLLNEFKSALVLFLDGENVYLDSDNLTAKILLKEDKILTINRDNFESIVDVIKLQNYLTKPEEIQLESKSETEEDARVKAFKERMKTLNQKVSEIKNKNGDGENSLDLYNTISALASKSYGINELNVGQLTVYQVYSKFKRIDLIDKYDTDIKSILAEAKADKIKMKHWSSSTE